MEEKKQENLEELKQDSAQSSVQEPKRLSDKDINEQVQNLVNSIVASDYVSINIIKVKIEHPKAFTKFVEHLGEKTGKEYSSDDMLITMLAYNPMPILFDFFDSEKVYVNIVGSEDNWSYSVTDIIKSPISKTRNTSIVSAFYKAFEVLESKLTIIYPTKTS